MRRIALNLMNGDAESKLRLKRRRRICGYHNHCAGRLLFNSDETLTRNPCAFALGNSMLSRFPIAGMLGGLATTPRQKEDNR